MPPPDSSYTFSPTKRQNHEHSLIGDNIEEEPRHLLPLYGGKTPASGLPSEQAHISAPDPAAFQPVCLPGGIEDRKPGSEYAHREDHSGPVPMRPPSSSPTRPAAAPD